MIHAYINGLKLTRLSANPPCPHGFMPYFHAGYRVLNGFFAQVIERRFIPSDP
jgi:hypothetical protein